MLQARDYVVLLRTKPAEMTAFRNLSLLSKDRTFPIFQARPWQNANHFRFTLEAVKEAVDGHPFGLALDAECLGNRSDRPAQKEFDSLFDPRGGYRAYYDVLGTLDDAVPVLFPVRSQVSLAAQIRNATELDRGLIVHLRRGRQVPVLDRVIAAFPLPHDTVVLVDAEWSRDYPSLEAWTTTTLTRTLDQLPGAEIAVMASGFPDSFGHIVGTREETILERRLFAAMRQRFNYADLTYGDWGSTRPRQGGGGGSIPSRIDVAGPRAWTIFRADPAEDEGYSALSDVVVRHAAYRSAPDCYGKQLIAQTGERDEGITGTQKATTARISIHMTVQSGSSGGLPLDEQPYVD